MNKSTNDESSRNTITMGGAVNDRHDNTNPVCEGKHDEGMSISEADQSFLLQLIRQEPNWPRPGINFLDLSPAFGDPRALNIIISALVRRYQNTSVTHIAGIDARGFTIGCACKYFYYLFHCSLFIWKCKPSCSIYGFSYVVL